MAPTSARSKSSRATSTPGRSSSTPTRCPACFNSVVGARSSRLPAGSGRGLREARTMNQHALVALVRFLLAHELHRIAKTLDGRFDRHLDVLALESEAVDAALNVFEPGLRLVEQQL